MCKYAWILFCPRTLSVPQSSQFFLVFVSFADYPYDHFILLLLVFSTLSSPLNRNK